jgi:hypothetical protein
MKIYPLLLKIHAVCLFFGILIILFGRDYCENFLGDIVAKKALDYPILDSIFTLWILFLFFSSAFMFVWVCVKIMQEIALKSSCFDKIKPTIHYSCLLFFFYFLIYYYKFI